MTNKIQTTYLETPSSAHERLRTDEHHEQYDDEQHARGVGVPGYEPEQFRVGSEKPFRHRIPLVVQIRIVINHGACGQGK